MKKTILALVAIVMMVCLAVPVSAAAIKLNGKVGYENDFVFGSNGPLTLDDVLDTLELDLGLSITEGDFSLKLGANIEYNPNANNFANISSKDWYAAIDTKNFEIWYSTGMNEGYAFEPLGDVFGLGDTIYDGSVFSFSLLNSEDSPLRVGSLYSGLGYTYKLSDLLHVRPSSLLNINAQIGKTSITAYYAPSVELYIKNIFSSGGYQDVTDPLMNLSTTKSKDLVDYIGGLDQPYIDFGDITSFDNVATNVVMFRSETNLFASLKIGATVTYAEITQLDQPIANFGLDLTSDIPLLGGNLALAFAGTIDPTQNTDDGFFNKIKPLEDGYGFYAGILNVPLNRKGNITLDVDFAAAQIDAYSPFTLYNSDFIADTKRLGVALAGKVEVGNALFNVKISNDFQGPYEGPFTEDILGVTAGVVFADDYKVDFKLESLFDLENEFENLKEGVRLKLDFAGKINDQVNIGANFSNLFLNINNQKGNAFATQASIVYKDSFEATEIMDSADFTLAGSLGYLTGGLYYDSQSVSMNNINKITYNLFGSIDTLFANKFGLEGGLYLGYNPEMHPDFNESYLNIGGFEDIKSNPLMMAYKDNLPSLVISLTAKYYFSPSVYLYGTGTFRNWWTFKFGKDISRSYDYENPDNEISHLYGQVGVTVNTKQNTYVNVSLGDNGLAHPKYSDPEKNTGVLPWSYLEIAPKDATYTFLKLNVNFEIKF